MEGCVNYAWMSADATDERTKFAWTLLNDDECIWCEWLLA